MTKEQTSSKTKKLSSAVQQTTQTEPKQQSLGKGEIRKRTSIGSSQDILPTACHGNGINNHHCIR